MKRGENFLNICTKKGKIHLIFYYIEQLEIFLKNLSHIAPVSPIIITYVMFNDLLKTIFFSTRGGGVFQLKKE